MSYARRLLTRWSRRDRLSILVIAVAVAFLTGTTLLLGGVTAATTQIAADYTTPATVTLHNTPPGPSTGSFSAPVALTQSQNQSAHYALGVPPDATRHFPTTTPPIPTPATGFHRYWSHAGASTGPVTTHTAPAVVPSWWLVANISAVERLGPMSYLQFTPVNDATPTQGTPLRGVYAFFAAGTTQITRALVLLALGTGFLVSISVFSVVRVAVRDRERTIRILLATGATTRRVRGLFTLRGGLLTAIGTGLGYALGLVFTNAAITVATFLGLGSTLSGSLTRSIALQLLTLYMLVLAIGMGASYVATRAVGRLETRQLHRGRTTQPSTERGWLSLPRPLRPSLLDWRAFVPTTATLATFLAFALVVLAIASTLGPVVNASGATVTDSTATHPIASSVPAEYADVLRAQGVNASAELLAFTTIGGEPVIVRGVNYTAFDSVTEAALVAGEPPTDRQDAIVGQQLARALGVEVGDRLPVGGSTTAAISTVTVTGIVSTPGFHENQLFVSLPLGYHLTGKPRGTAQFIRTAELASKNTEPAELIVVQADAPSRTLPGRPVTINATVVNPTQAPQERAVIVSAANQSVTRSVRLTPLESREITEQLTLPNPGTYTMSIGEQTRQIRVLSPNALRIGVSGGSPVPPNSSPRVTVSTVSGDPVPNATVTVGNRSYTTGADGTVRIDVDAAGEYTVTATAGVRMETHFIRVAQETTSPTPVGATFRLEPRSPSVVSTVTARVALSNPSETPRTLSLRVTGPITRTRTLTLPPGAQRTLPYELGHLPTGEHELAVLNGTRPLATKSFTVTGDERLVSALAASGEEATGSSSIERAVSALVGNLQVILATLVGLVGVLAIGSTTATFVHAIIARRRTLGVHLATGAAPWQLLWRLLADTLRIGIPAIGLGLALAYAAVTALSTLGLLRVYGVALEPAVTLPTIGLLVGSSILVLLAGATLAARAILSAGPARLLETSLGHTSATERDRL